MSGASGGIAFITIVQASPGALAFFMVCRNQYLREAYNGQVEHICSPERNIV